MLPGKHGRSSNEIMWLIRDKCHSYPHTTQLGLSCCIQVFAVITEN